MSTCGDGCGAGAVEAASTPSYIRALWLVVLMNGGMFLYGVFATVVSGSVSVRADMLDFLGDAVATGVGLLLVGRSPLLRANVGLAQGGVLGLLGLAALTSAIYRAYVGLPPEPLQMGAYGVLGFAVNVTAALLLIKHRRGDATARAVWLYSRNDAVGNIVVVLAAGLVSATGSKLPDVLAGAVMAALFSHSALEIIQHARRERALHREL